jgi:hypothetical protein
MLTIFICYGKKKGKDVGLKLRAYFLSEGMKPFLASPDSPDIPSGADVDITIEQHLRNCHAMVVVCTSGLRRSQYAIDEIKEAKALGVLVIPLVQKTPTRWQYVPSVLHKTWHPIEFDSAEPEEKFDRLQIEIWRRVWLKLEALLASPIPSMEGPPIVAINPDLLRK